MTMPISQALTIGAPTNADLRYKQAEEILKGKGRSYDLKDVLALATLIAVEGNSIILAMGLATEKAE